MAETNKILCTLCDPSAVLASAFCPECDDFLCSECEQRHHKSKISHDHTVINLEDYNDLPKFVKDLQLTCDDHHGQRLELFCSQHNSPCCIRCALTFHKSCQNVAPLTDLVKNVKTSTAILDIESVITDINSYLDNLKVELELHKDDITNQKKKIRDEIRQKRKALNAYLDQLENNLMGELRATFSANFTEIETITASINKIKENIHRISSDLYELKKHASDVQIFLSLPFLQSMVRTEENCTETLQSNRKLKTEFNFVDKSEAVLSIRSLGDVIYKEETFSTQYFKRKEMEAQLGGSLSNVSHENVALQLVESKTFTLGSLDKEKQNIIAGIAVTSGGNIVIAEYNELEHSDRVSLHDNSGTLITMKDESEEFEETIFNLSSLKPLYTVARDSILLSLSSSEGPAIRLLDAKSLSEFQAISVCEDCYGVTGYDMNIFTCSVNGIREFSTNGKSKNLLLKSKFNRYSSIDCHDQKLYFTRGEGFSSVSCCDESGKHLWTYENPDMLQEARGVVVDTHGRVFVAGNKSNNIICLTQNGRVAKEVQRVSSPLALCFDEKNNQLIVGTEIDTAFIFRVSDV